MQLLNSAPACGRLANAIQAGACFDDGKCAPGHRNPGRVLEGFGRPEFLCVPLCRLIAPNSIHLDVVLSPPLVLSASESGEPGDVWRLQLRYPMPVRRRGR